MTGASVQIGQIDASAWSSQIPPSRCCDDRLNPPNVPRPRSTSKKAVPGLPEACFEPHPALLRERPAMTRLVGAMLLEQSNVSGPTCALHGVFGSVGQAPAPSRGADLSP